MDENGFPLTHKQCEEKFDLEINYLSYYSVCQVIKCKYNEYYKICQTETTSYLRAYLL